MEGQSPGFAVVREQGRGGPEYSCRAPSYARAVRTPERFLALVWLVALAGCGNSGTTRQEEVAERGAEVMPFDLDATTHRFVPLPNGLEQVVVADDPADSQQVNLIRQHLETEQHRFQRGDYTDPAHIHGTDMPGLATLQARAADVEIVFSARPDGARLLFSTSDPQLIETLHEWGRAQVADHGAHPEHGDL